jgi:choice-of-anchor B domain-containing protein
VRAHNIFIDTAMAKLYVLSATSNTQFKPMSVYDISYPTNPQFLYSYENVNHVHDAYVYNDTAYLNCGSEGLKVIRSANNFPIQIGELTTYLDKGYNHSGWLNKSKNTYIMCDETYGMNIKAINVSDLNDIQTESLFNSDMGDDDNSVAHNVIVRNDIAYVSYYHDGLQVFDVSNPSNVKKLGFFDTYNNIPSVSWAGAWGVYPFRDGERILVSDRANGLFLIGFDVPQFVNNETQQEVQVFPNPAQDYICVFREHFREADYDLTIFDISGRKLRSYKSSNDFFKVNDLSHFKSGIYFLSYRSNIEAVSFKVKFIKN